MIVEAATPDLVRRVAEAMRARDREEFMAVSSLHDHRDLVDSLVRRFGQHPDVIVVSDSAGPVVVGGLIRYRPNVASLLLFATDGMPRVGADLTRFIKHRLFAAYRDAGVHRIECSSLGGYTQIHRWLRALGLKQEARMEGFGRDGQTYLQFSWTKEGLNGLG